MFKKLSKLDKVSYDGGYPSQEDSTYFGWGAPYGTTAYEPAKHDAPTGLREGDTGEPITICPTCKSDKIDKESSPAKCQVCGTNFIPKPDRGSDDQTVNDYSQNYFWGPNDLGRSHQNQPGANGWLPAGTEDADGPSPNVRMSSFKSFMQKQSSLNKVAHCGPCSALKMEVLHVLIDLYYKDNNLFPEEVIEELSVAATELKLDNFNDILESVIEEYLEEKAEEVGDKLPKLKNLLIALKDIAPKLGKEIEVVDKQESVEKEADLKEFSNEETKGINDFIIQHPKIMRVVIDASKRATDEKSFTDWLQEALTGEGMEEGVRKAVNWTELGWAWFNTVYRETTEPTSTDIIDKLPTLNKSKKLDELLDQLSIEKDPQKQEQIKQHIERIKNASLNKQANPETRLWVDPNGKEFPVNGIHGSWIKQNQKLLKQYEVLSTTSDIKEENLYDTWMNMKKAGWVRVSNEPAGMGFQIEVNDIRHLPPFVDGIVDKYFTEGDTILVGSGDDKAGVEITNPFPSLQKAVNKELSRTKQAFKKEIKASVEQVSGPGGLLINVLVNPTANEILGLAKKANRHTLRGLVDPNTGDLYVWEAYLAVHTSIISALGLDINCREINYLGSPYILNFSGETVLRMLDIQKEVREKLNKAASKQASLDEVLDQTTQDAIAAEYGPDILLALRFYNDAIKYGQPKDRALAYALEETKRMHHPVDQIKFLEVLNTYF